MLSFSEVKRAIKDAVPSRVTQKFLPSELLSMCPFVSAKDDPPNLEAIIHRFVAWMTLEYKDTKVVNANIELTIFGVIEPHSMEDIRD